MSTTRNGNTSFQSTKLLEICLKYGKRYLLDNYNNSEPLHSVRNRRGLLLHGDFFYLQKSFFSVYSIQESPFGHPVMHALPGAGGLPSDHVYRKEIYHVDCR